MNNRMLMTAPYVIYVSSEHELINIVNGIKLKPDKKLLHLLNVCITPTAESALAARFDKSFVDRLVQANYICPSDQVYKLYNIMLIEIGTTNYCNNRCLYCPMREYPVKEKKVMDMDLFYKVLQFAQKCDNPHLTLNFYNEPTLDPLFHDRIRAISETDLKCTLQTNGAGLDELKLTTLEKNKKNLHKLIINLPSVDPDTYQKRTGSVLSSRLMGNIKRATEADINTEIVVIGTKTEIDQNISAIQNMFSCKIIATKAHDVAGIVKNYYNRQVHVNGLFSGCPTVVQTFNISAQGDVFLCSRDFFQENSIGNAYEQDFHEILSGKKAEKIRKIVFGGCEGEYVCRGCSHMQYFQKNSAYTQVRELLKNGKDFLLNFEE